MILGSTQKALLGHPVSSRRPVFLSDLDLSVLSCKNDSDFVSYLLLELPR